MTKVSHLCENKWTDELYTLNEAYRHILDIIGDHRDLVFIMPMQIVDGAVCEFKDVKTSRIVASGRLRMANDVKVDTSGRMSLGVFIHCISLSHQTFKLSEHNKK